MTAQLPSKERLAAIIEFGSGRIITPINDAEIEALARYALSGMEQKLRELVEELLTNGDFYDSAIEQGDSCFSFWEWKVKAEKLIQAAYKQASVVVPDECAIEVDLSKVAHNFPLVVADRLRQVILYPEPAVMPDYEGTAMTQRECYRAGLEAGKAARISGDWIKCSDRMPEAYGDTVIVWCKSCVQRGYYTGDGFWLVEGRWVKHTKVTHWMPMLAAPQPEEKQ